ncbi:MAG TPA: succinyl-diaminopimelate desuccinylase, partial [Aliiroseovarius sp.]|nr:succinyl-diaminopimelate desuccinylase [Aliiroseovarius sp.]
GANRSLGFNAHTAVGPVGDEAAWTHPPFSGHLEDGTLWGRGATDMKSGVAAWVAAAVDFVRETPPDGALILTITGDEEADALHGTTALLDWMAANGEAMTDCVVGEPTSPNHMGEMLKIGRRGSMTAFFTVKGVQGHSAYPHRANNPVHAMAKLMARLAEVELDQGTEHFDPTTLQVTAIETGNPTTNVIPAQCRANVNIRYNDSHTSDSLTAWLGEQAAKVADETGCEISFTTKITGESFLTPPGPLSDLVAGAVKAETGNTPTLSTSGGTSDARFVKDHCPVVECGLVGRYMHAVDERVPVEEITQLKEIYGRIMRDYFA